MSVIDDLVAAYMAAFPHSLTMEVLFAAIDEKPEDAARKLQRAVQTGEPLTDADFQATLPPDVYL